MPYPYGTQGAPVVGNGLGGLPRRAVAAAAAATGVQDGTVFTHDPATKVTFYSTTGSSFTNLSFGDPNGVSSLTKVTSDRFLVPFHYSTDSGTYGTLLKSIQVTASGITVSSGTHTIGDNNNRNFRCNQGGGFMSGNNYVQPFCPDGTAAYVDVVSLGRTQIAGSFTPPTSGTVASGVYAGASYSSAANISNYMFNATGSFPAIIDNGDGTGTLLRKATVYGSTPVLMAFVYNASLTLLDTHVLSELGINDTTNSVGFAYYEDISDNRRVLCFVASGPSGTAAIRVVTFNKTSKTYTSLNRTYGTSSYSQLGQIFVQTSRSALSIGVTGVGGSQYSARVTCLLDSNRAPTTAGTDGNMKIEAASEYKHYAVGQPFVNTDGTVVSIGGYLPSYGQTKNAIDAITTYFSDPGGATPNPLPLTTKYLEYSVTSASGYKEMLVYPYVATTYISKDQSSSVSGDYSANVVGMLPRISDTVFLGATYDSISSGNYLKELGFVLFKAAA